MLTACVKLSLSDAVNNKVLICSSDDDGCLMKWTNAFVETISSPHSLQSLDFVTPPPPPYTHTQRENSGDSGFSSITALGPAERHSPALYNNNIPRSSPLVCELGGGASVVTNDWCITKQTA